MSIVNFIYFLLLDLIYIWCGWNGGRWPWQWKYWSQDPSGHWSTLHNQTPIRLELTQDSHKVLQNYFRFCLNLVSICYSHDCTFTLHIQHFNTKNYFLISNVNIQCPAPVCGGGGVRGNNARILHKNVRFLLIIK